MTFFWLIVLILSVRHLLNKNKLRSSGLKSRTIIAKTPTRSEIKTQRETEWDDIISTLTEKRKKREKGEHIEREETIVEASYRRQVEGKMKPGYQNDPEWQRGAKEIGEMIERNREKAKRELNETE